ncbi:MAG TPA: hypothetical protein VHL58_11450 [Thermoanaerobaculia bacterium]|nr:hypothetical protein [Thermoanaerobaculia bacterium]
MSTSHFQHLYLKPGQKPEFDPRVVDVAILDMNHGWPNVGHDAIVHSLREMAERLTPALEKAGLIIRALSYDVRRAGMLPETPGRQFSLYIGTGGPGHLDPRENDGSSDGTQGIKEDPSWEAPLFGLFQGVLDNDESSLFAVCHTFGIICRWTGAAEPALRGEDKGGKSTGIVENILTPEALEHPFFSLYAAELPDHRHLRVIDNRLYDLIPGATIPSYITPVGFETNQLGAQGEALTMMELARDRGGIMPRFFAVNHHPEILDRQYIVGIIEAKFARGEVTEQWYQERIQTLRETIEGDFDFFVRLTSSFTFLLPIEFQLTRLVRERAESLGFTVDLHENDVIPDDDVATAIAG